MLTDADRQKCKEECARFLKEAGLPEKLEDIIGRKFTFSYEVDCGPGDLIYIVSGTVASAEIMLDEMYELPLRPTIRLFTNTLFEDFDTDCLEFDSEKRWRVYKYREEIVGFLFKRTVVKITEHPGTLEIH